MATALQQALSKVQAPKVSLREIKGQTYQAQAVQAAPVDTTNNFAKLMDMAKMGTQAYGQYVQKREEQGQQRKNEILLKNMQPEQIKSMRDDGTLLYQDDPYAMRALERELGRQEAYNADAIVTNKIKAGDFNSRQEMEEFRSNLHEQAQTTMAEAYGVNPNSTYYREGLQEDIVDRNMAVYNAQALKTDQAKRNETRLVVENNLQAIIKNQPNKAEGIIKYLDQARKEGMLNETEFKVMFQRASANLAETGSVDQMKALLDSEITVDGVKTTYGTLIGDEQGNQLVLATGSKAYSNNQAEQIDFERGINRIVNSDVSTVAGAQTARDELERQWKRVYGMNQNHPMWTQHKAALLNAETRLNANIREANERNRGAIRDGFQRDVRYRELDERMERRIKGEAVPVNIDSFEETQYTGAFTTNDYAMYYSRKMQEIASDDTLSDAQKVTKRLTLGNVLKETDKAGFGAWYGAEMGAIRSELDSVTFAANAGQEVPDTPKFNEYKAMYVDNPQLFMNVYGEDAQMALDLATAQSLNVDYATYTKGAKTIKSLDPASRKQFDLEWSAQVDKQGGVLKNLTPQQREIYRGWAAATHGIGFNTALSRIVEHAEATFVDVKGVGTVKRSILMTDPKDPSSADKGVQYLTSYMDATFGDDFKSSQAYSVGDSIIIMNPNGKREIIDRQKFLEIQEQYK